MNSADKYLIVIAGPTASGKTGIAINIAQHFHTEIISADARQIYREMKIGTAVPDVNQLAAVKHHVIQSHSIHDPYDVGKYETEVLNFLDVIFKSTHVAVLAGGSGLFIKAITDGLDEMPETNPELRKQLQDDYEKHGIEFLQKQLKKTDPAYYAIVDTKNPHRLMRALEVILITRMSYTHFRTNKPKHRNFKSIKICLDVGREELYHRIDQRVDEMFEQGFTEEAKQLLPFRNLNALQTVGYTELFDHFEGKMTIDRAKELIKQHSRNYAKRQITWFKREKDYHWISPADVNRIIALIDEKMSENN